MNRTPRLLVLCFSLVACSSGHSDRVDATQPKGNRTLAIDLRAAASETYDEAFDMAAGIGVDEVTLSFDWNDLETPSGYTLNLIDIADAYYPAKGMPIALVLRPINTNVATLPSDIASLAFDHATVIARFEALLTALHSRLSNTSVVRIQIGNEVDSYLGTDSTKWAAFTTFLQATRAKARSLWGNVPVGCVTQWGAMTADATKGFVLTLNQIADDVVLTYYPLNTDFTFRDPAVIESELVQVMDLYPARNIVLQECGYPSGALCNSSETQQSEFILEVFRVWDLYPNRIVHIDFSWQTDVDPATVSQWIIDYGMTGHPHVAAFDEYLSTLGLRSSSGVSKLAWANLAVEMRERGWAAN